MAQRKWTEEQERAIRTTDRTLLLSAAAGSGKTATLTERLVRMVTDAKRPLDVSRMLIVTFTRAAAQELRERIGAALSAAIDRDPENRRLTAQSLLLPSAKIRTIDSFCNDLVKGHTEELGIPMRYRIPDEAENAILAGGIMEELLADAYADAYLPKGAGIVRLSECAVGAKNEKELSPLLLQLYDKLRGYPNGIGLIYDNQRLLFEQKDLPYFDTLWGGFVKKETERTLAEVLSGYRAAVRAAVRAEGEDGLCLSALGRSFTSDIAFLEETLAGLDEGYTATRARLGGFASPKAGAAADGKLSTEGRRAKAYRKQAEKLIRSLYEELYTWEEGDIPTAMTEAASLSLTVADLLAEFHRRYSDEKRRRRLCDYNDLEHFALRLLTDAEGTPTAMARELALGLDAVCIDEYQDVNEVQHRIFSAISTPTNRFMVGDIKQSIYGFRGAQPDIFAALRRRYAQNEGTDAEGNPLPAVDFLTKNFRSEPALLSFSNGVFDFVFGILGKGIGYAEEDRLYPGREPLCPIPPELTLLEAAEGENKEEAGGECGAVADRIADLLANERRPNGEPYLPSDIAVLLRGGRSKIEAYAAALRARGIPVFTEDRASFFTHPEILLALCLCHTVSNPLRDIYLAGLLRSPLYGFTMDELVRVRTEFPLETLYHSLVAYAEAHEEAGKHRAFLDTLSELRKEAEGLPADRLIRMLFDRTGLFCAVNADGRRLLLSFYDYARRYEASAYHGLYRFLSHVNDVMSSGRSFGKRTVGNADGVSIVTVHHSKGLEYPVCFLADTAAAVGDKDGSIPLLFDPVLGLGLPLRDRETGLALFNTPVRQAVAAARSRAAREEEARVLYVALTRPRERLYLSAKPRKKIENLLSACDLVHAFPSEALFSALTSYVEWMLAALGTDTPLYTLRTVTEGVSLAAPTSSAAPTDEDAPPPSEGGGADEEDIGRAYSLFKQRFEAVYPHHADTLLPGKLSVSRLYPAYLDAEAERTETTLRTPNSGEGVRPFVPSVPLFLSGVEKDAAALAGTATHVFLQFCEPAALLTGEPMQAARQELARLTRLGFMTEEDAARVRLDEIAAFAVSPLLSRILDARSVRRELRFNVMLPAEAFTREQTALFAGRELFVQGVIDLIFTDAEGRLVLVDYKTDRLTEAELAEPALAAATLTARHGTQLSYYAMAVERIFGRAPDEILIYSLHAGRALALAEA